MQKLILSLALAFLFARCKQPVASVAGAPKDVTITPQNAYSSLFLDSLKMESFLAAEVVADTLRQHIRNFYNRRNYAFAWFNEEGLTVQAEGFWNTHDTYLNRTGDSSIYYKQLHLTMDKLLYEDSLYQVPKDTLNLTELRLTTHFFDYVKAAYGPKADPEELQWHIPKRKLNASALLDSLLVTDKDHWKPLNKSYYLLQDAVVEYRQIEKSGGWPVIETPSKKIRTGSSNEVVAVYRRPALHHPSTGLRVTTHRRVFLQQVHGNFQSFY